MLRRVVALLLALCVVHVTVASAAEQCVSHVRTHCGHPHDGAGQTQTPECCQLGTACTPWALTVAETSVGRVVHATPPADEPTAVLSPRLAPEPPPPRA
jgi:hypothetical protein